MVQNNIFNKKLSIIIYSIFKLKKCMPKLYLKFNWEKQTENSNKRIIKNNISYE